MTLIQNRRSKTSGSAPTSVADGELVLNQADGLLFYADAGGTVRSAPLQGNAPLTSPAFTGTPTAPTAPAGDSSTRLATTGFVTANFATASPLAAGTASAGSAPTAARSDHVHPTDATRAKAGVNGDITALTATLTNTVFASGLTGLGQFVAIGGNYGAGLRNDGANVYLMQTSSGSATGTWNGFRPFCWNLSSGAVTLDATGVGVNTGGSLTAAGNLSASSGQIFLGNGSNSVANINLNGGGSGNSMQIQHLQSGRMRWLWRPGNGEAESGSNAGSNLDSHCYADDGSYIGRWLYVNRASRQAQFDVRPLFVGQTPYDTGNLSAGQIGAILGYTPGRVSQPVAVTLGSVGDIAVANNYTYCGGLTFGANAPSFIGVGGCMFYNTGGSALVAWIYIDIYDNTAGGVNAQGQVQQVQVPPNTQCVCNVAVATGSLTIGRAYQFRMWATKNVAVGPVAVYQGVLNGICV